MAQNFLSDSTFEGHVNITGSSKNLVLANSNNIRFKNNAGAERNILTVDTNDDVQFGGSIDNIRFLTNDSSEKARIDSSGLFALGTTSPSTYNSNTNNFVIRDTGSGGMTISTGATSSGFYAFNNGEDAVIEGLIQYNHSDNSMRFRTNSVDDRFIIAGDGNATFAGDITLKNNATLSSIGNVTIDIDSDDNATDRQFRVTQHDAGNTLFFVNEASSQFSHSLAISGGNLSISGDGSNAVTLTESGGGDFTIDAVGDIAIDADGGDIRFKDGSVGTFGAFTNTSSNFEIRSSISDKDIIFKGNDAGVVITALTLDMSAAGKATFNAEANGPAFKAVGSNTSTNVTSSSDYGLRLQNTSNTDGNFIPIDFFNSTGFITGRIGAEFQDAGDRNTDLYFATRANSGSLTEAFRIDSSQNATFAGDVRINGNDLEFSGAAAKISGTSGGQISLNYNTTSNQPLIWYGGGTSEQFKVTNTGDATFGGNIRTTADIGRDDHNRIMFSTDDSIIYRVADTHRFRMDSDNFSPYADSSYDLGTSSLYFRAAYIDAITTTGNVTVGGDLTVNGTTTTVNQTNLDVSDNIIGLNRGAGSNANDSGIIIERGSTGDNAAFLWDESIGYFSFGTTQETASSTGAIANESDWTWKPIKASGAVYTGGIYIGGTTEMTGYAYIAERIVHTGDTDTYLRFVDNNPHFFAGGVNVLDLQASETQFTGDLFTFTSANSTDPLVNIKNTTNDTNGARLRFTKDKGAAGADDDVVGQIEFVGDNAAQELTEFAKIQGSIETAADGTEGGRLRLGVASHDGEMRYGLVLHDGDAEDEIDVSIGGGAASVTTVAGDLSIYNKLTFRYNDNHYLQSGTNNWAFKASSGSVALSLTTGGAAEFAGNVSVNGAGQKAVLHVKNEANSWEDGVLLEHHTGNTGWNIHPEDNSDNALWFGYNSDTSVALTSQAATAVLKLNSDKSAVFEGGASIATHSSIGSTSLAASNAYVLDVKKAYSSGNGHVAYFGAGVDTAAKLNYDTVVIAQDDVTCLAIIEGNDPNTHSTEQALRLAVGDNSAVISSTSTASNGMYFYTNRDTDTYGYQINAGTRALHLANTGNATFGYDVDFDGHITLTGSTKNIVLNYNNEIRTKDSGGTERTVLRAASNKLQYGWSYAGEVEFMGGGSYTPRITINTDGSTTFASSVHLDNDSAQLQLGDDNDMQVYHNGTHGYVKTGTGDLVLQSNGDDVKILAQDDVVIRDNDDSTEMAKFINGGAVELYHNGSKKFETTSAGAKFSGTVTVGVDDTGYDVKFFGATAGKYMLWDESADRLEIVGEISISGDGSNDVVISESGSGHLTIDAPGNINLDADGGDINLKDGTTFWGQLTQDSSHFIMEAKIADKDIILRGTDNTTQIDALRLDMSEGGNATFRGTITLGVADSSSGHINAYENMTFNIDTDNDDTNRYFAWYTNGSDGSGTELLKILETGAATFSGTVLIDGVSNYTGLEVKGTGASRPSVQFSNVNQGDLGQIYGTENNALVLATGTSSNTALTLDSSQNATFAKKVDIRGSGYHQIHIAHTTSADTNKQSGITTSNYEGNNVSIFQTFQQNNDNTIYFGSADGSHRGIQNYRFYVNTDSDAVSGHTEALHIGSDKAATFAGNVTIPEYVYHDGDTDTKFGFSGADAWKVNTGGSTAILAHDNGSTYLYHSGSQKFETTSTGISITGNVGMTTGHSSGKFAVMSSSVHASYDFYNNGTSYFNGATIIDDTLTMSGTNARINFPQLKGVRLHDNTTQVAFELPYFTHATADLAADIILGNHSIYGILELTLTSGYSHQNAVGEARFKWILGVNADNSIWYTPQLIERRITHQSPQIYVADPAWDSTNSRYHIRVYHVNSNGNNWEGHLKYTSLNGTATSFVDNLSISGLLTSTSTANSHPVGHFLSDQTGDMNLILQSKASGDPTLTFNSEAANRNGMIKFQDQGTQVGQIDYTHNGDTMNFYTGGTGSSHKELTLNETDGATFRTRVRIGTSTETANTNFDDLVIENVAGHSGMSIFSKSDSDGAIYFGDVEANNLGQIKYSHGSNAMTFATNDGAASLTLDSGLNATFAGNVNAGTGLRMYTDGSGNGVIYNLGQDKDLYLVGDDGGSGINALVFDMSEGGAATFAGQVTIDHNDGLRIKSHTGTYHKIYHNTSTNDLAFSNAAGGDFDFENWVRVRNGAAGSILFEVDSTSGHTGIGGQRNTSYELYVHGATYLSGSLAVNGDANITGHVTGRSLTSHNNRGQNHGGGQDQEFPIGHWNEGEEVFSIDPTWTNDQLQNYFGSSDVEWLEDSTAPAGWAIKITNNVNVGGAYDSGFPYIAIDEDAIYYMECHIRGLDSDTSVNHYMGSIDYKEDFTNPSSGAGNPGSYGYWAMQNANTSGQTWTKATGIIRGFHNTTTGMFETGAKYWTPQALFNYSHGAGTRACVISGWKVVKISKQRMLADGAQATPSLTFAEDQNTGIYRPGTDAMTFATGGSDAILLDSSQHATFKGSIRFNDANTELKEGSNNAVRIDTNSGWMDIGPMNTSWCHIQTDRSRFYFNTEITVDSGIINSYDENLILRRAYDSTYQMTLSTTAATFTHDVVAFSDKKLKKNIKTLDGSKVYDMRGVSFTRKDNGEDGSGVIAQEIQKVAPELVNETDGTLGVSYGNITGYLIEAVKDLKAEIEELKKCNKCNDCNNCKS